MMLLSISNPKVQIDKAKNVYAMYTWLSKYTGEPQADLIRVELQPSVDIQTTIEYVQGKPVIQLRGVNAKLHQVYVDNQENPLNEG